MTHSLLYFAAPGRAFVGKRTVALPHPSTRSRPSHAHAGRPLAARVCLGAAGVPYVNRTVSWAEFQALSASYPRRELTHALTACRRQRGRTSSR